MTRVNLRSLSAISLIAANSSSESLESAHHTLTALLLLRNGIAEESNRTIVFGLLTAAKSIVDESEVHGLEESVSVDVGSVTALSASNVLFGGRSIVIGNWIVQVTIFLCLFHLLTSISHSVVDLSSNSFVVDAILHS